MRFSYFCLVACLACILCIDLHAYAADDSKVEGSKVLENLTNYDSIYESGFTVSATMQGKDEIFSSHVYLDVKRRWRLTFGGDRVGYLMEVVDYEKPKYQRPEKAQPKSEQPKLLGGKNADADETQQIPIRTKQWGYWGSDLSGNHYEDTVFEVTPAGDVAETGKMYNSSVFGPRDEGPIVPRCVFLWSLGRFFSKYLDKVTRVEESTNGRLVVSALGKKAEGQNGRWELEIEPAAAWMVRKAQFYWDINPKMISVEMKNDGTVWSGAFCIPKEAVANYCGSIAGVETERLTFEPVVEKFDEALYGSTQQAVVHNQTPTLTLHDYRVSPPVVSEPFQPNRTELLPIEQDSDKKWIIAVNLVLIVILLAIFIFRRYRRKRRRDLGI